MLPFTDERNFSDRKQNKIKLAKKLIGELALAEIRFRSKQTSIWASVLDPLIYNKHRVSMSPSG